MRTRSVAATSRRLSAAPAGRARLGWRVLAAYAAPAFSQTMIHGPTGSVIQGVYAKYFGVSLQSIATVLLVASVFDATASPVAGYPRGYRGISWGGALAGLGPWRPWSICRLGLAGGCLGHSIHGLGPGALGAWTRWDVSAFACWCCGGNSVPLATNCQVKSFCMP